jgi:hypothetical protein
MLLYLCKILPYIAINKTKMENEEKENITKIWIMAIRSVRW